MVLPRFSMVSVNSPVLKMLVLMSAGLKCFLISLITLLRCILTTYAPYLGRCLTFTCFKRKEVLGVKLSKGKKSVYD